MKSNKQIMREQLEKGMSIFLSTGKQVTKVEPKRSGKHAPAKEQFVEIEVDHLPESLRKKHFGNM